MKRLFILATAATVALASCTKTQVVYNEAPQEIGFKAVTGVMTKAAVLDNTFVGPMTVYAYNNANHAAYFTDEEFTNTSGTDWTGTEKQYYPTVGSLDFVAFTEFTNIAETATNNKTWSYTLTDNSTSQNDFMVSNYVVNQSSKTTAIPITFKHALSCVAVNFKCTGQTVQIDKVVLSNTYQSGTLPVSYTVEIGATANVDPDFGSWSINGAALTDVTYASQEPLTLTANANDFVNYANFLVVPDSTDNDETLEITYTINNNQFTHTINLTEANAYTWELGTKQIFNITIGLDEIKFSPSVIAWTEDTPANTPEI